MELENLNHLFHECKTGTINEYKEKELTMPTIVLKEISNWIFKIFQTN